MTDQFKTDSKEMWVLPPEKGVMVFRERGEVVFLFRWWGVAPTAVRGFGFSGMGL